MASYVVDEKCLTTASGKSATIRDATLPRLRRTAGTQGPSLRRSMT